MGMLNVLKKSLVLSLLGGCLFLIGCSSPGKTTASTSSTTESTVKTVDPTYCTATLTLNGMPATDITDSDCIHMNAGDLINNASIQSFSSNQWEISKTGQFKKTMPAYLSFVDPKVNLNFAFYVTQNATSYFCVTSNILYTKNTNLDVGVIDLKPRMAITGVLNIVDSTEKMKFYTTSLEVANGFGRRSGSQVLLAYNNQIKIKFFIDYSEGATLSYSVQITRDDGKVVNFKVPIQTPSSPTSGTVYDVGEIPLNVTY